MGGWFHKEIKSVADVRTSRCASAALLAACLSAWAVFRRTSPAGEIYSSLEKGTIDAAEWVGPMTTPARL